ncbi:restriction endonuclease subunit S [Bacteroides sp. NSJ-39]|uniref:restriction endonuclease subunit S n=1 Tax=Bacteroides sp. NSJ-39 TaxID=2763019 RepID=UPI002102E676|nr:restriction endonuclease subunit S [Bacteroides sp. NSJ-39]
MEQWKKYQLKDVTTLLGDGLHGTPKYDKNGTVFFINGNNLVDGKIEIKDSTKRVSEDEANKYRKNLNHRTILVSINGTIGNVAKYQGEACILGKSACYFNVAEDFDLNFIYYVVASQQFKNSIMHLATGTTIKNVSLETMRNYSFVAPSINEQKRISSLLSSLDNKIDLNRRINDNLEQQAQALFKSWFVDFEPFKDGKFVESELGIIPKGWRVGKAEDFYYINIGKTPPRKEQVWFSSNSSDYIWVSISDLGSCGRFVFTSSEFLTHEAIKRHNIILVPKDTILLSFKLTIGRVGIAGTELTTNEAIARFITSDENREYTYFLLKGYNYEKLGSTSSIATAVNSKIIKAMVVLMPDKEILKAFSSLAKPYFDQILRNEQESIRLTILRDTLLPKLMSGELKINATEVL